MTHADGEVAMMMRWTGRTMAGLLAGLLALAAGVMGHVPTAAAASGDRLFWVASTGSVTDGLYGATAGAVPTATNLNGDAGLYRTLSTDGTYLYFNSGGNLVRTALDGTGMTTVVAGVGSAEQIAFAGGYVYYTTYSGGVFGASLASLPASASQIFTASGSGWNGVAISGNTIFATYNNGSPTQGNQGLWAATLNGTSAVTATMIDAAAVMTYRGAKIAAAGGNLYLAGSNGTIPVRAISTGAWTSISVSAATGQGVYSVAPLGSTLYFSTSNGAIGSVATNGTGATLLSSDGQFTSSWSVTAAAPAGTTYYPVTYNADNATSGTAPTDYNSPYADGSTATVLANTGSLARTGYVFRRWNTATGGAGTPRAPGATFTVSADTDLYPEWTGGPLEFSESLSPWSAVSTVEIPSTPSGTPSTKTVYVKNTATVASFFINNPQTGSPNVGQSGCGTGTTLVAGATCTLTLTWTPSSSTPLSATYTISESPITYSLGLTGTVTQPARTPTFSTPVSTADGFTVNVTNYDASWSWTPSVTTGSVTAGSPSGSTLPLTVTGLAAGASATVTVETTRSGYVSGSGTVNGSALSAARTPTFSSPVSTADGFTVNVTNYSVDWMWTPSVTTGSVTAGSPSGSTLPLTVTGLAAGASATVTVEATRAGYVGGTATVNGSASPSSGGGGGGGSSSSGATPEPSPTPTVSLPSLGADPVPGGLAPGADRVTVGGAVVPVVVTPNPQNTGLDVSGPGWRMSLAARTASGQPAPLGPNGVLRFVRGQGLATEGIGFKPNSPVQLFLFSDATFLGELTTDATGSFSGAVDLPPGISLGAHVAQVNGYTTGNEVRSVSLGIEVVESARVTTSVGSRVYFPYRTAKLTPTAKRTLRSLASQVPAEATASSVVVGIVQAQAPRRSDRALARKRAVNVARYLKAAGLPGVVSIRTQPVKVKNVAEARRVVVTVRYTR